MTVNYINEDFCAHCGGYCCQKCGCFYYPEDLSLTYDGINDILTEGYASISTFVNFLYHNEKEVSLSFTLALRARNLLKEEIDLLSLPTPCALLTEKGCLFTKDKRPSGGIHLIPSLKPSLCHYDEEHYLKLKEWEKYHDLLSYIIEEKTGLTYLEKLQKDIENYFYEMAIYQKSNGSQNSLLEERLLLLPALEQNYPMKRKKP